MAYAGMLGYGAANIGAGVLQGFTVTGGLSASATAERVGAKSPLPFLVSGLMALLTILFLAGLFADLPEAILGERSGRVVRRVLFTPGPHVPAAREP